MEFTPLLFINKIPERTGEPSVGCIRGNQNHPSECAAQVSSSWSSSVGGISDLIDILVDVF